MSQRLHLLAELNEFDSRTLNEVSIQVLNRWAKRIETEGLSVSLDSIAENALLSFSLPDNADQLANIGELANIGDRLIDSAAQIESLLCTERMTQSLRTMVLPELENAANSGNPRPWGETAKEITGLANGTHAARKLQRFCGQLLIWDNPPQGSAYRKLLSDGADCKAPALPERLRAKLKERFLREKKFLRSSPRK